MVPIEKLRMYPCFAGADRDSLIRLAQIGRMRSYGPGEVLFEEDTEASELHVVMKGEVDIVMAVEGRSRVVDTVGEGDLIQWSAVVKPHRTTASAAARGYAETAVFEGRDFVDLCEEDHRFGYHLMQAVARSVSRRLQGAHVMIAARD